jgi:hypothetical protein
MMIHLDNLKKINNIIQPYGCIVGGALRSCFEGTKPRDIDIFCTDGTNSTYDKLKSIIIEKLKPDEYREVSDENYMSKIIVGLEAKCYIDLEEYKVTIIAPIQTEDRNLFGNCYKLADEVDFNICAMALEPNNSIYFSPKGGNILEDIANMKATYIRDIHSDEELWRACRRISKYKSYGYSVDDSKITGILDIEFW